MMGLAIPLRISGVSAEQGALALSLLCALVVLGVDVEARAFAWNTVRSRTGLVVGAVFACWALTIPFSMDPLGSLHMGGRTGLFLLGVVLLYAVIKTNDHVHSLLLKVLVGASTLINSLVLLSFGGVPYILSTLHANFSSPEIPALAFKSYAAIALCLIPVMVWAGRRLGGVWAILGYAGGAMGVAILFLTANRSTLAGLLAMIVVAVLALILARRRFSGILTLVAIVLVSAILIWVYQLRFPAEVGDDQGLFVPVWLIDMHRQHIWSFAFERFLESPWVGHGIDQLNHLPGANVTIPGLSESAFAVPSHPHNWALEILAETGLVGFLPMLTVLGFIAWRLLRRFARDAEQGALAQLVLMAGFWGSAMFNFSIWAVWWQLTFMVLFAIVAATPRAPSLDARSPAYRR